MSDYISRQAAISAICNACGKIDCDKMDKCEKLQLPPANCSEFPNNSDTISRQAAIDRAVSIPMFGRDVKMVAVSEIKNLPSAQPEPLTDKEQRIFLVPVVRCRDCKFRENDDFCTGRGFPCQLVPDDGFCDKGGRKE